MRTAVQGRVPTTIGGHAASRGRSLHSQLRIPVRMPAAASFALTRPRVRTRVSCSAAADGPTTGVWEAAAASQSDMSKSDQQSPVQSKNGLLTSRFFTELVNTDRRTEMRGEELLQKVRVLISSRLSCCATNPRTWGLRPAHASLCLLPRSLFRQVYGPAGASRHANTRRTSCVCHTALCRSSSISAFAHQGLSLH